MTRVGCFSWHFVRSHHPSDFRPPSPSGCSNPIALPQFSSLLYHLFATQGTVMTASLLAFSPSVLPGLCLLPLCGEQPPGFICNAPLYLFTLTTPSPDPGLQRTSGGLGSASSSCVVLIKSYHFSGLQFLYLSNEWHAQVPGYSASLKYTLLIESPSLVGYLVEGQTTWQMREWIIWVLI